MPSFVTQSEQYVKLRLGLPFLTSSKAVVSIGYGAMTDKYYQSNTVDFSSNEQDRSHYNLFMASMKFDRNNLNSHMYPTAGVDCSVLGLLAYGKERFRPFFRIASKGRHEAAVTDETCRIFGVRGRAAVVFHLLQKRFFCPEFGKL